MLRWDVDHEELHQCLDLYAFCNLEMMLEYVSLLCQDSDHSYRIRRYPNWVDFLDRNRNHVGFGYVVRNRRLIVQIHVQDDESWWRDAHLK